MHSERGKAPAGGDYRGTTAPSDLTKPTRLFFLQERFYAIRESLKPIRDGAIDLDKLIHALSFQEGRKAATAEARSTTERKLENVLSLRTLLRSLGPGELDE